MLETPRTTVADAFARLVEIVALLRSERGCPWDRAQTHASLRNELVEETYEVVEAVDNGETAKLAEELGDLLLCVALYVQIAEEAGAFSMLDVLNAVNAKLVRRHPHVFGDLEVASTEEVLRNWEAIKRNETAHESRASVLDGVPPGLPALMAAVKLQQKAARVGFDWEHVRDVLPKLYEELEEVEELLVIAEQCLGQDVFLPSSTWRASFTWSPSPRCDGQTPGFLAASAASKRFCTSAENRSTTTTSPPSIASGTPSKPKNETRRR